MTTNAVPSVSIRSPDERGDVDDVISPDARPIYSLSLKMVNQEHLLLKPHLLSKDEQERFLNKVEVSDREQTRQQISKRERKYFILRLYQDQ